MLGVLSLDHKHQVVLFIFTIFLLETKYLNSIKMMLHHEKPKTLQSTIMVLLQAAKPNFAILFWPFGFLAPKDLKLFDRQGYGD
jgi:hypothetical protein